jgi:hypothetical protein
MLVKCFTVVALTATVLMLAVGCASKSDSGSRAAAPPATTGSVAASPTSSDVTGLWQGNVGVGARTTSVSLNLREEGEALKGSLAVGGRPDLSGPVTGRIEGDTLRLRLDNGAVGPQVQVKGDTMTGMISGEPLDLRRMR